MKRTLILLVISSLLCSTGSAFQGGGGESTKKKADTRKKSSGAKSDNTTPPRTNSRMIEGTVVETTGNGRWVAIVIESGGKRYWVQTQYLPEEHKRNPTALGDIYSDGARVRVTYTGTYREYYGDGELTGLEAKRIVGNTSRTNTAPRRVSAQPVETRIGADDTRAMSSQAADRERQGEATRIAEIAEIAERARVEQSFAGEWADGTSRLTITKDGNRFNAVYVSSAKNRLGELLPQTLRGELLPDNQLRLTNTNRGKIVNPRYYYSGDFNQEAWIELGIDNGSLIVRFSDAKNGRSLVMNRIVGSPDSQIPKVTSITSPPTPIPRTRTGPAGIEFVLIPPGSFMMGSNNGDADEKRVHQVTISVRHG